MQSGLLFHRYHRPHSIKYEGHVLEPKKQGTQNKSNKQTNKKQLKKKKKKAKKKTGKQTNKHTLKTPPPKKTNNKQINIPPPKNCPGGIRYMAKLRLDV